MSTNTLNNQIVLNGKTVYFHRPSLVVFECYTMVYLHDG